MWEDRAPMIVARCIDPRRVTVGPARPVGRCTSRWDPAAAAIGTRHQRGQQKVEYAALESLFFFNSSRRGSPSSGPVSRDRRRCDLCTCDRRRDPGAGVIKVAGGDQRDRRRTRCTDSRAAACGLVENRDRGTPVRGSALVRKPHAELRTTAFPYRPRADSAFAKARIA